MKTNLNISAKFDRCLYNTAVCLIQDFKTGFKEPVRAKLNSQMRVNAMLVALNLQQAGIHTIERFIVQIVTMPFGVMEAEFSRAELAEIYEEITGTLSSLESPNSALNPSLEACEYCAAILICGAVKDTLKPTLTMLKASPIDVSPERLAENLDAAKVIRNYLDEFEEFCAERVTKDPKSIKNYTMVPGSEKRHWKEPGGAAEAKRRFMKATGRDEYSMMSLDTYTVATYQKEYAKHYGKKPNEAKESFNKLMDGCIEIKQDKPSLKRIKGESLISDVV